MKDSIIIISIIIIACVILRFAIQTNKKDIYPYKARPILSPCELDFYNLLRNCISSHTMLFSKVRLWDVLDVTEKTNSISYTNKIRSKHVDFIITDKSGFPLVVIELDDKSHNKKSRKERDEFVNKALAAANINIIHVKTAASYDTKEINQLLSNYIQ